MANPQVTPAGGASSSWGPEEIVLNPNDDKMTQLMGGLNQGGVVVTDGQTKGFVHHSKIDKFLADNPTYEKGTIFSGPDGNLAGVVKASQAGQFRTENPGYQPGLPKQTAGWNPRQTSPFSSVEAMQRAYPSLQPPSGVKGWAKTALGPVAVLPDALRMTRDAAGQVGQYLRAEAESPNAAPIVQNVTSPVGEAAAQFVGSQYEPQNLAMLGAFSALPRNTAALRTLHRAIGGYFAGKTAQQAVEQTRSGVEAARQGDVPEAVRQFTGAGFTGGMAGSVGAQTGEELAQNRAQLYPDLARTVTAPVAGTAQAARGLLNPLANLTPAEIMSRGTKPRNQLRDVMPKIEEALPHARAAAEQLGIDTANMGHDEALDATRKAKQNIWDTLERNHLGPAASFMRDTTPIADGIQATADRMSGIAKRRNPSLVDSIESAAKDYRGQQMSVADMEQRIQELNNELYSEQTKLKVQQDQLRRDPAYAYRFAELEGLRGALDKALTEQTGPGARELKRTYGSLKTLEDILDRSRNVANRPSPVGLFGGLGKVAGVGNMVGGAARTIGGDLSVVGPFAKGAAEWYMGKKAAQMNDRNFLVGEAFRRTAPAGALPAPQVAAAPAAAPATPPPSPLGPVLARAPQARAAAAGAQGSLQFGMVPSETSGFPEAQVTQPVAPPFAGAGQPKPQTPAPAEKVAPAAPEAQRGAFYKGLTPERQAIIDEAHGHLAKGTTDKAVYDELRNRLHDPEADPEHLRGTSIEKNRYGENGKSTKEAVVDENGEYAPERDQFHRNQAQQILGPDPGKPEAKPVLVLKGGGTATGKTAALGAEIKKNYAGVPTVDADVVKFGDKHAGVKGGAVEGLPEAQALLQSDPMAAAARLHEESSDVVKMTLAEAKRRGQSVIFDTVGGNAEATKQIIRGFLDKGYEIHAEYADRPLQDALKSMGGRFDETGRWVPPDVMEEGHENAAKAYHEIAPYAHKATLRVAVPNEAGTPQYQVAHRGSNLEAGRRRTYNGSIENNDLYEAHRTKGGLNARPGVDTEGSGAVRQRAAGVSAQESQPPSDAERNPATEGVGTGRARGTGEAREADTFTAQVTKQPLHVAEGAPPKGKPVTVVYGGAFNPPHEGHVAALQASVDLLNKNGHKVDRIVVAPTADKLLAQKVDPVDHLQLPGRIKTAEAAFPKEINGVPVEVHSGPAEEAEAMTGKPKRRDLADWAQRQNPNHTIINVAGEDASAPGSPKHEGPKLYQGAEDTAHEGINYIELPRLGEISSTKIRNALGFSEDVPHMTPESARVYREEMAKQQGGPPPPSGNAPAEAAPQAPARQTEQVQQGARLTGHDDIETSVLTPTGNELKGRYRVVEGDTLTPSHDPFSFAKNPNYPEGVQERAYHSSKEAQNRVIQQAQNYDPRYTVTDDPTGGNGPAVITPDGTVLGGNSRVMSTQRLYREGNGDVYKNELIKRAAQFGLDPEQIRGMKNPQLVREIDAPASKEDLRRIGKDLNRSMTGAPSASERAVSAGRSLRPESLQQISDMQKELGEDVSLRQLMDKRPKQVLDILQRDGLVTDRERPQMVDTSTGGLSEDGKNFVEKAMLGSVIDDPDLMDRAPKSIVNKLGSAIGELASLHARADNYNIGPLIRAALREHVQAAQRGGPFEDYINQQSMFGGRSKVIETLAHALNGTAKPLRKAIQSFAQDARADVQGQGRLDVLAAKPSAANAFNHAFGTDFSEREFEEALRAAWESEGKSPAAKPKAVGPAGLPRSIMNPVK